ncbi:MAG: cell division protein FtsL [Alphaproteobacteria bacterium]
MLRTLNFALVFVTAVVCLGLYRVAEEARMTGAELRQTERAIAEEKKLLRVLGAEWSHVTQPARIAALAERHLALADRPAIQLSSLAYLPHKVPAARLGDVRTAQAGGPANAGAGVRVVALHIGM